MAALSHLSTAAVADVLGGKGVMCSSIGPYGKVHKFVGRAFTASTPPGDMLTCYKALHDALGGMVLVIDGNGYQEAAIWGGLMTREAGLKGLAGVVINGAVRDLDEIRKSDLPVFAVSACARDGTINAFGEIGAPINCGGATVHTGDYILGDEDGVIAIPEGRVDKIIDAATGALEMETTIVGELDKGKSLYDLFELEKIVVRKEHEDFTLLNELIRDLGF